MEQQQQELKEDRKVAKHIIFISYVTIKKDPLFWGLIFLILSNHCKELHIPP